MDPFSRFFEAERSGAIRLAWLLTHDKAAAEDIAHDAFTAVFKRFDRLENPAAYLRRAVVNGVYERSRRREREQRRLTLVSATIPISVDGPSGGLIDAIASLPLKQRTVVVLRYWNDLDDQEIAQIMEVRSGTVRSLRSRATAQLRKAFTP